uniref:BOD1/SHG1 domain-containing protein n=1 Tax=Anopheles epiroticus TaxID=199890 RepID=A0A182P558_9DIPT
MIDDPHFIDAMVQELKSQGLFDQFRKECLADVDTKPAYQNLRQRVEGTVNKFLGQQEWSDNIRYKNQLREQLRKNIIESGFLDTGVERIVDQVVNPKIATIFQPKVEEIVYNYLGIEKPKSSVNGNEQVAPVRPESLLEDLEAVSPDSDKKSEGSLTPSPPPPIQQPPPPPPPAPEEPVEHGVENMDIDEEDDEVLDESKEQDDFESPAFEPLEVRSPSKPKDETNDSNSSVISGLTSQESVESDPKPDDNPEPERSAKESTNVPPSEERENPTTKDSEFSQEIAPTNDSQLSQVSSNSQLLTATVASSSEEAQPVKENERLDITEEAQMPTLFSSSTDKVSSSNESEQDGKKMTFDFKKDEYDFVGTGRPSAISCGEESYGDAGNRQAGQEEESSTPSVTPAETPTETPNKPKDSEDPNVTPQDEETSQSEHSLKICEDTFSDDNSKDSQSKDAPTSTRDSPSKIKGLSDASSCSLKSESGAKTVPSSVAEKIDEKKESTEPKPVNDEKKPEEETMEVENDKDKEESEQKHKSPKSNKAEDDHYQEHHKHESNRRSSDRDSEDGNDKQDSGGSAAPPADATGEKQTNQSQESTENAPEKEKSPAKDPSDRVESPMLRKERERLCGSVTPTSEGVPIDSSSSGIQSGDDSEKSPETLKSYSKPESIVLPVQPVVIDQMLTNMDDDKIERLLNGEMHTNDATLESLKRQWQSTEGKIRKPKFASNFSEARRLMKVRKQIQRQEQKCREQALAMAKKYINENKAFAGRGMEDQGIELEFVCDGKRKSPGPMISSPIPKVEQVEESVKQVGSVDPELYYFPEEEEVFQFDERRLHFLRSKTDGVTFSKNFKVEHYRTMIYSLTVTPAPTPRVTKRATPTAAGVKGSAKAKRAAAINGVTKKLDLTVEDGSKRAGLATIRKQRSIRNRLVEKSTPPSVGTDA